MEQVALTEVEMENPAMAPGRGVEYSRRTQVHKRFIPDRWKYVVVLHLSGKKRAEIAELTGYAPQVVGVILANERSVAYRQQLLSETQQDFEAIFSQVVDTIRDMVQPGRDDGVRLQAAQMWLKAHGKFLPQHDEREKDLTAEDVVAHILHADTVNIQINNKR